MALPNGYTQLEYIESNGNSCFNTGFNPNNNTRVVMDAQGTMNTSVSDKTYAYFGAGTSGKFYEIHKGNTVNWVLLYFYGGSYSKYFSTISQSSYNTRITIDYNKNSATIGSETLTYTATTFSLSNSLYLFATNRNGTVESYMPMKLYSCQIYDNGALIRDYVPCKNSSGVAGLYDLVNSTFSGSATSTAFIAGTEIVAGAGKSKCLIDGTVYAVASAKAFGAGTAFKVPSGKFLKDGTVYDISFGASIDPVFANNDWSTIIAACESGSVPDTWQVGDNKTMTIGGVDYQIDIIGKNHDTYTSGGTAPLTFETHNCFHSKLRIDETSGNACGWKDSELRTSMLPNGVLPMFPAEVQAGIKEVNKLTAVGNNNYTLVTTADKLFLLSGVEYANLGGAWCIEGEGTLYEYYKNATNETFRKTFSGALEGFWTRSPNGWSSAWVARNAYDMWNGNYSTTEQKPVSLAFCF